MYFLIIEFQFNIFLHLFDFAFV